MISLNIGNVVTIAAISVLSYAAIKFATKALGVDLPWLA